MEQGFPGKWKRAADGVEILELKVTHGFPPVELTFTPDFGFRFFEGGFLKSEIRLWNTGVTVTKLSEIAPCSFKGDENPRILPKSLF